MTEPHYWPSATGTTAVTDRTAISLCRFEFIVINASVEGTRSAISGREPHDLDVLLEQEAADQRAFASHERHLRGLLEQELLLRARRPGPDPSSRSPRRRPCLPRRREQRRRATRDG